MPRARHDAVITVCSVERLNSTTARDPSLSGFDHTLRSSSAIMLAQRSPMSPVVRHRLPVRGPHSHGRFEPHSQMLNTMGRPALASASRNLAYCVGPSSPSELHQSSLT